ncbi:MAG: SPOR domain-containing protein [Alphaproteobacteria bacterium]|nr:SPOR domain-containing protein [Alphaproteobacteria bacterium]NCQ67420.1 SPOR domain-containing protein [Alphaproteobacteria bacterium]NCT08039.1 SPOR domain-containing protein [Alphaproteobacteria bacterium]
MQHSNPYQSNYTKPERTNPEISFERDALDSVRKLRATGLSKGGIVGKFNLSMPVKISAVALIFAGVVLSVWTMKSSRSFMEDDDLPTIANDFGTDSFKVAPGEEDAIQVPHSDKEFYSELEPAQPTYGKEAFRATPEAPSEQVSQEALFVEAGKVPETEMISEESTEKTRDEISDSSSDAGSVSLSAQEAKDAHITVVEAVNDVSETYKAPAPTVSNKPKKTLEIALGETQQPVGKADATKADVQQKAQQVVVKTTMPTPSKVKSVPSKAMLSTTVSGAQGAQRVYWVQIASLPTQAAAQKEWMRLQGKAPQTLKGQSYKTVRVDLGKPKGIRYRVHVGPFSKAQAVQKCRTLKGSSLDCLVIKKK